VATTSMPWRDAYSLQSRIWSSIDASRCNSVEKRA
jgi:hypothetical protein